MARTAAALLAVLALAGCRTEVDQARALLRGDVPAVPGSLAGGLWLAEDINGGGVPDYARIDISFDPETRQGPRVQGRSGCNSFSGAWRTAYGRLRLGPLAVTRKACAPALMDAEARFLSALEAADRVVFDETGAATLTVPDGRRVRLRRETGQAG